MNEAWNALVEHFLQVKDALGKPIDPEIFETVVVFNALDIPTVMSCGGHLEEERGLLLPWVDIEPAGLGPMKAEEAHLIDASKQAHEELSQLRRTMAPDDQIKAAKQQAHEIYHRLHTLQWQLRILQSEPRRKLAEYLEQFYHDRMVSFDLRLVLEGKRRTRLHSQGAVDLYLTAPIDVQRQKLENYREEMAEFTMFLKQTYFSKQSARKGGEGR